MQAIPTLAELNLAATLPALIVSVGMCLLLLIDLWIPEDRKSVTAWLAQGTLLTAFIVNLFLFDAGVGMVGMFIADDLTGFLNMVVLATTFIGILLSMDYLKRQGIERGEFYSLILFSATGAMFMVSANDLVLIFVALELLSIPLYVMAAFRYPNLKSEESGLKYFILGAFAGAFFVYGSALVYGATGSTNLSNIFDTVSMIADGTASAQVSPLLLALGSGLILVGLGFKVAVFPFHMWTPDVYEGAPTNVTAYMSIAAKVGGFAALVRIFGGGLSELIVDGGTATLWQLAVATVAGLTMILGNFVALAQTNMKRMLAYSSIAHAGYILMAVAAAGSVGVGEIAGQSAAVYLLAYMFTNMGAFAVVMAVEKNDGESPMLDDFIGFSKSQPLMAMMMMVFMLSLIGIPLTGGFFGKYLVFSAAVRGGLMWLTVIGVLTSVISAFYYMRVVVNMYLRDDEGDGDPAEGATQYLNWAIYASFAGTLILGILPMLATSLFNSVTTVANLLF